MKFENIYCLCKKYYNDICRKAILREDGEAVKIIKVDDVLHATEQLAQIECLKESSEEFLNNIKNVQKGKMMIGESSSLDFKRAKEKLLIEINTIISLYESMSLHTKEFPGIDIKIPNCENFMDFKKIINEIDFIITKCPFIQREAEFLRFEGIDVGSQWISFVVSGAVAVTVGSILLNNIAAFVDKCIIIRSHYLTTIQQKLEVQKSQIEQNEKDELIKNINRIFKIHIENAIKELEEKTGCKISDGDERGRAEQSLQKMGELIDKGLQIYSSIDSPQETKALFEPLEMKYLSIEQELKAIEDKKNKQSKKEENDK